MKRIESPSDITLCDPATGAPIMRKVGEAEEPARVTFLEFFVGTVLCDPKFGKDLDLLLVAADARQRAQAAKDGAFDLSDTDHAKIVEVMKAPTNPYNPAVAMQLRSFFRAVLDAKPVE